jgi:hypothetical protein
MTSEELNEWTARVVMGWYPSSNCYLDNYYVTKSGGNDPTYQEVPQQYICAWHPSANYNQCFRVVEKMRERGWYLSLEYLTTGLIEAKFIYKVVLPNRPQQVIAYDNDPATAILLAAHEVLEGREKR